MSKASKKKLELTGDKTYEFYLPPKLVKAIESGGWVHLGIVEEKGGITRYYLDGVEKEKIDWSKVAGEHKL